MKYKIWTMKYILNQINYSGLKESVLGKGREWFFYKPDIPQNIEVLVCFFLKFHIQSTKTRINKS